MELTYRQVINEKLKDPNFRREWEAQEPRFQLIKAMLMGRKENHLSQQQLSERTGIPQADISRLETGDANPTLDKICRIANALNMNVKLTFEPKIVSEYM